MSIAELPKSAHDEACATYAALILHDAGAEISSDKMAEIIKASGNEVEAYSYDGGETFTFDCE